ncbi:MAG: tyrosine-type recombinase/integrase [Ruminiclostridium sp.]
MKELHVRRRENKLGATYEYRFEVASVNGKRKFVTKGGFKNKTQAKEAGKEAMKQYEDCGYVPDNNKSFSDFLDAWVASLYASDIKLSTIKSYEKIIKNKIKPKLGNRYLTSITNQDIQELITGLYDSGTSVNTLVNIRGILTKSFRFAVIQRMLAINPIVEITIPRNRKPLQAPTRTNPHVYITQATMDIILARFPEGASAHLPLMLGYYAGLRLGEAFALTWEDIDFEKKELNINKQVQWQPVGDGDGYWYFEKPKYSSTRIVPILYDSLFQLLERTKKRQEEDLAACGEYYAKYYIKEDRYGRERFTTQRTNKELKLINLRPGGTYCHPRIMQHTSMVIRLNLGIIEYDYHSLRHTFATNLVNSGARPEYVQKLLGHSKLAVTMDTYYKPTDEHRREQAEEIRKKLRQQN